MFENIGLTLQELGPDGGRVLAISDDPALVRLVAARMAKQRSQALDPASPRYLIERARYQTLLAIAAEGAVDAEWTDERPEEPAWWPTVNSEEDQ